MKSKVRSIRAARYPGSGQYVPPNGAVGESGNVRAVFEKSYELVRRRKWLIFAVFLAVIGASVVYLVRAAPEYQASSVILVEQQKYDPSNALSLGYISGLDNSSESMHLLVVAQSTDLADRVAERVIELGTVPGSTEPFSLLVDDVSSAELGRRIQLGRIVVKSSTSNVITVSATGPTAHEAAALANLYAEEAVEQSRSTSRRRVAASRQFLEQQIVEGRSVLETSEDNLQEYMRREGAIAITQEVQSAISNLAQTEASRSEAQIELEMRRASIASTEAELSKIRPMLTQRVASGVDREIAAGQTRLAELELRLEQIFHNYPTLRGNPQMDPQIASLQDEIAQLRNKIQTLSEQYVNEVLAAGGAGAERPESGVAYAASLERQLITDRIAASGLESKIEALERQQAQLDARLQQAPKQTVEIAQLQRDRESAEQLYSYLERRLQEARLAEESETGSLRLLRPAEVPRQPVSPRPERIFPLSLMLGLLLGLGAAALSTQLDRRIYNPEDVTKNGYRLLGVVPDMRPLIRQEFDGNEKVELNGHQIASNMVALLAPHTAAAEAYRHLFARLRPERGTNGAAAIIVTSPEASVGKSTTALNLAITAASAHQKTLIIDVDMRRPAVELYLGEQSNVTLQSVLSQADPEDAVAYVDRRSATGIQNLHAITIRHAVQNPIKHLVSPRLRDIIQELRKQFDFIIFDAPPLLLTSDAALLAPLCDETVVVAAAGVTDSAALRQIAGELAECNARLGGIVLNRFDASNPMFRSTYGYLQHNYSGYYRYTAS